jgi:transposase
MKLHRNAKTTPASRLRMVQRVLHEGWSYVAAAEAFAVTDRTVAKWVQRFRQGGVAGLEDASSRPGPAPHQTPPAAVVAIRALREQHGLPAWAIGRAVQIPRSTVSAWLRRLGLNRPPVAPPVPVQRYESAGHPAVSALLRPLWLLWPVRLELSSPARSDSRSLRPGTKGEHLRRTRESSLVRPLPCNDRGRVLARRSRMR